MRNKKYYEKPTIEILVFHPEGGLTTSGYNHDLEGYGDEISWD